MSSFLFTHMMTCPFFFVKLIQNRVMHNVVNCGRLNSVLISFNVCAVVCEQLNCEKIRQRVVWCLNEMSTAEQADRIKSGNLYANEDTLPHVWDLWSHPQHHDMLVLVLMEDVICTRAPFSYIIHLFTSRAGIVKTFEEKLQEL